MFTYDNYIYFHFRVFALSQFGKEIFMGGIIITMIFLEFRGIPRIKFLKIAVGIKPYYYLEGEMVV